MFPSRSGILAEVISIAFTSLLESQSIFLPLFLQCQHLHQSRLPILMFNKSAAEAWTYLVFFLTALIPVKISYSNM